MGDIGLDDAPDDVLVEHACDGDVHAFEAIVRRHGPLMRGYATRLLGSPADADDVVQDAFVVAWNQLDTLDDRRAVKAWLMRVVSRKSVDRIRSRRQHADIADWDVPAVVSQSTEHTAETHSELEALSRALRSLPAAQRGCWVLREIGGYSYQEIAGELEMPVSTVRGSLARARATLVRELGAWR